MMKVFLLIVQDRAAEYEINSFQVEYDNSEYRFIGVSIPKELKCSSYSWDLICNASVTPFVEQPKLLKVSV